MKTFHILLLTLFVSASVFAQRPDREKIKALKIAHITEQMDLSKKEAQKFWPIYNDNEDAEDQLREKFSALRNEKSANELTESEAETYLLNMISIEKEKTELRSKLLNDLLEILPAKKIVALVQAEKSFRRKMIEEYKERQRRMKKN
ncbi:sensor of ECF-type sigma factor [Winogradskyella schleiferi]|uniref:sensor of ECF-type sigma factor n=1 Tax=Winogradskyella schleiferi TaxID=2686078 RepID=UPI0015B84A83|nr:sensor of ECF-type sigma factor [Winogradskyella schleiferi]